MHLMQHQNLSAQMEKSINRTCCLIFCLRIKWFGLLLTFSKTESNGISQNSYIAFLYDSEQWNQFQRQQLKKFREHFVTVIDVNINLVQSLLI